MSLYPVAVTVQVVLLFPDRCAMLDLFDDEATGFEGLVAMWRAYGDQDADAANIETALEVLDINVEFVTPSLTCLAGERLEGL